MKSPTILNIIKQFLLLSLLVFLSCKKDVKLEPKTPAIFNDEVRVKETRIYFYWEVDFPGVFSSVVKLSTNEDMSDAVSYGSNEADSDFARSVTVNDVIKGTTYYYCYEVWNPRVHWESEVKSVTTPVDVPMVETKEVGNVTSNSAEVTCEVTHDCGSEVFSRGLCWGTSHNPTIESDFFVPISSGSGVGSYKVTLTELYAYNTYYVRAYATNSNGTAYGNELSFVTEGGVPSLTTSEITDIEWRTAKGGGEVLSEGGAEITQIGLCWATSHDPVITGNHINLTYDHYIFTADITDLLPNTTYYVRAYAKNSYGVGYGEERTFVTKSQQKPVVTTAEVTGYTSSSANVGGEVTSDGGETLTERGVYYGTSPNPSATGTKVPASEGGTGSFTCSLTGLNENTKYYVCAFATNSQGTSCGEDVSFTTPMEGALGGVFSVSATNQVYISQGNLQYQARTNTWRFAENQLDRIGADNSHISQTYNGWIDLFGWGTSGYDHGAECYQPWSTTNGGQNYCAYGSGTSNLYDGSGKADWGYNPISNGGNQENSGWRTMTWSEWDYLLMKRNTPSGIRFAFASVNGVNGIIVLPDNWSESVLGLNNPNGNNDLPEYSDNNLNASQWAVLEEKGVAFLPATGTRDKQEIQNLDLAIYWTSTCDDASTGYYGYIYSYCFYGDFFHSMPRYYGMAVRLVHNVE